MINVDHGELADLRYILQVLTDDPLMMEPIHRGVRVKQVGDYYIDLVPMLVNWRIVVVPANDPLDFRRAWCYIGRDADSYFRALTAAVMWDGAPDTEPPGWNKSVHTGEFRPPCSVCETPMPDPGVAIRVLCDACRVVVPEAP